MVLGLSVFGKWPLDATVEYQPYLGPKWVLPQWLDLVLSVTVINVQALLLNQLFNRLRLFPVRSFLYLFLFGFSHYVLGLATGELTFLLWELTLVAILRFILSATEDEASANLPYHLGFFMGLGLYFMPSSWVYFPSLVLMVLTVSKLNLNRLFQWLLTTGVVLLGIAGTTFLFDAWGHRLPLFALPQWENLAIKEPSGVFSFVLLFAGIWSFVYLRFLSGSSTRFIKDILLVFTYLIVGTALHGLFYPRIETTGYQLIIAVAFLLSLSLLSISRQWLSSVYAGVLVVVGLTLLIFNSLIF
jgi:hypothetical protein